MQGSLAVCRCRSGVLGWPVSHRGGNETRMLFPSWLANQRERGNDDSSSHICVLAAPAVDIGKWGEQMSVALRTGKEMKKEIREEDKVVCVPVAMIQTRAGHLATLQLLREVRVGLSLGSCGGVYLPRCVLAALRPFGRAGFGVKESQESNQGSWKAVLI